MASSLQTSHSTTHHSSTSTSTANPTIVSTHRQTNNQTSGGTNHAKALLEAKVVILGTQGVGKTSLVHRYTSGHFNASSIPSTIGASFLTKKLLVGGTKVRLQIWDTAGQERFRSMAPMYYRGSNAAIIVYDITSMTSFLDVKTWLEELRKNMNSDLIIHIVGSKSDLNSQREVKLSEAKRIIRSWVGDEMGFQDDEELDGNEEEMRETSASRLLESGKGRTQENRNSISKLNLFGNSDGNEKDSTSTVQAGKQPSTINNFSRGSSRFGNTISNSLTFSSKSPINPVSANQSTSPKDKSKIMSTSPPSTNSNSSSTSSSNGLENRNRTLRDPSNSFQNQSKSTSKSSPEASSLNSIQISEVSAKDDEGIEDVFLNITSKLVEKKLEIEKERRRRDRESIMIDSNLDDQNQSANPGGSGSGSGNADGTRQNGGWTCC